MIRSRWAGARPRRLLLAAAAVLIPVLAGCEAGNNAPTLAFHYPTAAAGTAIGPLSIRNVFILGAPLGKDLAKGSSASVFLSLINNGAPDKLVSIRAPGTASTVALPAGGIPVVAGHPVYYSGPLPRVALQDLTRPVRSGSSVTVVLVFQNAGQVVLQVPVMPRTLQYASLSPPPAAASPAPPTAQPGLTASQSASPGASAAPSATPSATPSP